MPEIDFSAVLSDLAQLPARTPGVPFEGLVARAFVDEFVTEDDWRGVWRRAQSGMDVTYRRARGANPEGQFGRQVKPLLAAMPLYREMVATGQTLEEALSALASRGEDLRPEPSLSTLHRVIGDLRVLLEPRESD